MTRPTRGSKRTAAATAMAAKVRRRRSRTREAIRKQQSRKKGKWKQIFEKFDSFSDGLYNKKGRSRTLHENKLLLCALKVALKRQIDAGNKDINCKSIEEEVSTDFRVGRQYLVLLRKGLFDNGDVLVFGGEARGSAAPTAKEKDNTKLTKEVLVDITKFIDDCHAIGKGVVARDIWAMLFEKHQLRVH